MYVAIKDIGETMTDREKKLKAAIAGVMQYIAEEQSVPVRREPFLVNMPSNWSFYGSQLMMLNRNQMQRRLTKR